MDAAMGCHVDALRLVTVAAQRLSSRPPSPLVLALPALRCAGPLVRGGHVYRAQGPAQVPPHPHRQQQRRPVRPGPGRRRRPCDGVGCQVERPRGGGVGGAAGVVHPVGTIAIATSTSLRTASSGPLHRSRAVLSCTPTNPHARRGLRSSCCPCWLDADWGLASDVVTDLGLQGSFLLVRVQRLRHHFEPFLTGSLHPAGYRPCGMVCEVSRLVGC